jgi:hypothetical protein
MISAAHIKKRARNDKSKKTIHLLICTLQRTAKIISVGCGEAFSKAAKINLLFSVSCFKVFQQIFFWTLDDHKQLKSFCCPQICSKAP